MVSVEHVTARPEIAILSNIKASTSVPVILFPLTWSLIRTLLAPWLSNVKATGVNVVLRFAASIVPIEENAPPLMDICTSS